MSAPASAAREALASAFEKNFRERGEIGASVSVWDGEGESVTLAGGCLDRDSGRPWQADTLIPVWSATKGPAALACLLALDEAGLSLEDRVSRLWPRFGAAGKEPITFAQVLSHSAGLCALDEAVSIRDHPAVVSAIEAQAPVVPPGSGPAYHARTFGILLDEIVRRATGARSIGEYFNLRVRQPMSLDFWMGLPREEFDRVGTLYPGKMPAGATQGSFLNAISTRGTLTQRAFASPAGLNSVRDLNQPDTWELGLASMGGVGSARALAKLYAMLATGGRWQGRQLVPEWCLRAFSTTLVQGPDAVLCTETAFGAGMMRDPLDDRGAKRRALFGPDSRAYGHPGAGGSLAFADPATGRGFAYVMNQMELGVLPTSKALDLVAAVFGWSSPSAVS